MTEISLKESDYRLLKYLYHDGRQPLTKIAKATQLTREQVEYKINKYVSDGIIKKFIPVINYSKLGYNIISILLIKFNNYNSVKDFLKIKARDNNIISYGELLTKYDLFIILAFENEKQKSDYLFQLLENYKDKIPNYSFLEPSIVNLYPLKKIGGKEAEEFKMVEYKNEKIKLDDKDKRILKCLEENARMKIIDIAKKSNISAELTLYKIRKLQKNKALLGTRILFNTEKLGLYYTIAFLEINLSKSNQEKLKNFAKNSPYVDSLGFLTSKPNCYIQLFHKEEKELRETLQKLKEIFTEELVNVEIIPVKNENIEIITSPFID